MSNVSINRVNISGNLTRDPELRATQGGTQILSFGVAVNDRRRNPQSQEWEDYPNFVDCVVFGARAEALSRFLHKGSKVAIEGKLRYSSWEARDGSRRSKLEVVVDEVEFLSPRNGNNGQGQQGRPQQSSSYSNGYGGSNGGYGGGYANGNASRSYGSPTFNAPAPQPQQQEQPQQGQASRPPVQTPPDEDVYDEDIPF